ncbi:hypothetical protein [Sphingomonas sanguinis]
MSKVIKSVVMIAVAVAVIVYAAPLLGAVASLYGASAAVVTAITSTVVGLGVSLALAGVGTLIRKAPQSVSQSMADRLQNSVVPSAPRKIVFGRTAAGADVRFFETWGSKKDRYAQVIALASHKVTIRDIYLEDDLTWTSGALVAHTDGINFLRAINEGSSANAQPLGSGAYWTSSSRFTGCAYLAIDWKLDSKAWPQGIPQRVITIVDGCPVYDPRLDSTAGGSGPHRASDQATWEFVHSGIEIGRNPALALLTYLIGYRLNGKLLWGMGIPLNRINLDNFRVYANVCEERVVTADGSTVQRYTADGIVSTADTHETVLSALTAAMGSCKLTDVGGTYGLVGGYDDTLGPKQAFDESDLVGGMNSPAPYSWVPSGPARETYNIVRGRFADPAQLFQLVDWGVIETDNLPDGVPRTLSLDLGFVSRAETCQRIAKQFLMREAKTPGFFTATFGPKAFAVQVGSLVTLSLPSQGWNNKLFRVQSQTENDLMIFQMTLREESSEVYAWDREEKPLPAVVRPGGYDASAWLPVEGLRLSTAAYQGVG